MGVLETGAGIICSKGVFSMPQNIERAIRNLVIAEHRGKSKKGSMPEWKPVVTVARGFGSWGDEIAEALAKQLSVECWNQNILDVMAAKAGTHKKLVEELDEKVSEFWDEWLHSLIDSQHIDRTDYCRHLFNFVLGVYNKGGVIVGRGAHLMLKNKKILRVRVTASADVCARRIANEENTTDEKALDKVAEVNEQWGEFVWEVFGSRLNDPTAYDLVINTDRLSSVEQGVELIVAAMKVFKLSHSMPR